MLSSGRIRDRKDTAIRIIIDTENPNDTQVDKPASADAAAEDLPAIARQLSQRLPDEVAGDLLTGKTRMRDEVMEMLSCSALEAERIVDSLVKGGHASFTAEGGPLGDPRHGRWTLEPVPEKKRR